MKIERFFQRSNLSVAALAAATLILESTLTRFLAVAQFYHFAFLVVSLALMGFGASGTLLFIMPVIRKHLIANDEGKPIEGNNYLFLAGIGFTTSVVIVYLIVNLLPFDSYSIAWDRRQIFYFLIYYLTLTLPFLSAGFGIGAMLSVSGPESNLVYAANLFGSGIGALMAPLAMWLAGVPGGILLSGLIGLLPAFFSPISKIKSSKRGGEKGMRLLGWGLTGIFTIGIISFAFLSLINLGDHAILGIVVSPYKGLAQAKRYPGSQVIYGKWNAISRLDVIANAGTRLLPGLSYTYPTNPPLQIGFSQDADSSQPISMVKPDEFDAGAYLPEAIAFSLRTNGDVLVLEPAGGLGVLQALSAGSNGVTAVVSNPLIFQALDETNPASNIYANERVKFFSETTRVFNRTDKSVYDVIFQPLTRSYRPITSGAFSLTESYDLTVEAFLDDLRRLKPHGLFVITCWLQTPPSESLRIVTTLIIALEKSGLQETSNAIVAYRGIQTMTLLVQPDKWSETELQAIDKFLENRRYDLVWKPNIEPEGTNLYNRLPEPVYYESVLSLFNPLSRTDLIQNYPFDITPPTDDRPFFYNFFTWKQTPELIATLGRTWQPFGGSGYLLLWALLGFVVVFSVLLIAGPLIIIPFYDSDKMSDNRIKEINPRKMISRLRILLFFGFLGLAFLFVEIPLIQRWILLLGHPTYAFTIVVLALLSFSGIGSVLARAEWLPIRPAFGLLILMALLTPWSVLPLGDAILGWSFPIRAVVAGISLAPLGILMGIPFPHGLSWLDYKAPYLIPWAWAVNGCTSVISAVLAAILALSYGFSSVLLMGAIFYAGAFICLPSKGHVNARQLVEQNSLARD